ncbi:MAG: hypothetical protein LBN22_02795 [Clostridiales Family XIII bacterium]|jgi:ABC-2 type transport system permease protein|nr:hypothetical protein [Clostridiales Family XIII bacterium]
MNSIFCNSKNIMRFILKQDRIWLTAWIIGVLIMNIAFVPAFVGIAPTQADLNMYYETMKNPAMIVMMGPLYAKSYTYGVMYIQMMLSFTIALQAIMNLFFVTRHCRNDEEDGRIEVLSSLPIGRESILSSTIVIMVAFNLLIGMVTGFGVAACGVPSMDLKGSLLFGLIQGATGLFFGGIATVTSQICMTARGANALGMGALGIAYMFRAIGDIKYDILNWFTPFGIAFKTKPYVTDDYAQVLIIVAASVVLLAISIYLNSKRDLYDGFLPQRKGRTHAGLWLRGAGTLSFRLVRNQIITWGLVIFILGLSYGSIFGDFEKFMSDNAIIGQLIGEAKGAPANEALYSFISYLALVMGLITTVPIINIIHKIQVEEHKQRIDQLYAKSVSKDTHFLSYVVIAFGASILFQFLCAFGEWTASASVMKDPIHLAIFVKTALISLPAIWIFLGLEVLLIGLLPKLSSLIWLAFAASFLLVYLGKLLKLPTWTEKLTPFSHVPDYPVGQIHFEPLVVMSVIFLVVTVIGIVAYRARDVRNS